MVLSWEDTLDLFRSVPMTFLLSFLMVAAVSSGAEAAYEFDVFRMYQYELHGHSFGCHGSLVNMEARTSSAAQLHRRCVVTRLRDLSAKSFDNLINRGAGSILVILPESLATSSISQSWNMLEQHLLEKHLTVPVYFAKETPELLRLHEDIVQKAESEQEATMAENLLGIFSSQGYQMVANTGESKPIKDATIPTLVGKLAGRGDEQQLPTLAIVAHYDAHSVSPHLAFGGDTNGSGVIALLELARLFSRLYADEKTKANFNLLFVLSGGGRYDYQGTRNWLDSIADSEENPLANVHYVLCLDSIGNGDGLSLHVSKPPKEGTPPHAVVASLQEVASGMGLNFTMVHKKINLAEDTSAWEHERFSMKRIPAATLSWYPSSTAAKHRHSAYDQRSNVDSEVVTRNIHFLAEGIAHYIFSLSSKALGSGFSVFNRSVNLHSSLVSSLLDHFSSMPRSQQLLSRDSSVVSTLEQLLSRSCSVTRHITRPDKRDPDFIFYDATKAKMIAYSIKPGIFDLVLAFAVALYLLAIFGLVQMFPAITSHLTRFVPKTKVA